MVILRHREWGTTRTPATLLYSSRSVDDVIYRPELDAIAGAIATCVCSIR